VFFWLFDVSLVLDWPLEEYVAKRKFENTPEPGPGKPKPGSGGNYFCVQRHDATRLHYDFRLEIDGVLKSWAVPKGPTLNPELKHFAAHVEEFPAAQGIGFESSPQAFRYASANAARLIGDRAQIRLADWASATGPFDLVFSNPPYIASGRIESLMPEVAAFEPRAALDGGPDGLAAYRALGELLPGLLAQGGHALLEIGLGQAQSMAALFPGLEMARIAPDLSGIPRCVILRKP